MEKKELKILITGEVSSGKSTVYYIIKEALKKHGIEAKYSDPDFETEESFDEKMSKNISGKVEAIKIKTDITIEQIQLIRKWKDSHE